MLAGWIQAGSKGSTTILPLAISSLIVRSLSTIGGIVASAFAKCKIRSKETCLLISSCHCEPFACCHPEQREGSRNSENRLRKESCMAQGKLREAISLEFEEIATSPAAPRNDDLSWRTTSEQMEVLSIILYNGYWG